MNGEADSREASLRSLERTVVAVGAALIAGSLLWRSPATTAGVAIGAAAMWLNFRWLRRIVSSLLAQAAGREAGAEAGAGGLAAARLATELVVKFAALVALVYLVVRRTGVDPVGLLVGLSTVPVAVVVELLRGGPRGRG
ncbi:MAG TPA: ATP synthase subunit I [Thermodesulfobacteriota bacterium]|nr:ATP synthase subunit I [Thermodesulfobacteriota bacterium]